MVREPSLRPARMKVEPALALVKRLAFEAPQKWKDWPAHLPHPSQTQQNKQRNCASGRPYLRRLGVNVHQQNQAPNSGK